MRKKQYRLQRCVFQLMTDGGWKLTSAKPNITLKKEPQKLYNAETEKWILTARTILIIRENTYKFSGGLSVFDMEVLEFYGYKPE